jgi:hypothetical protein
VGRYRYSNSREALEASAAWASLVEMDVIPGKDGPLVAHDRLEAHYGFDRPFTSVSESEFLRSKYRSELSPISLEAAVQFSLQCGVPLVLDIKGDATDYRDVLAYVGGVVEQVGALNSTVIQFYSRDDFVASREAGFRFGIFALWKNHHRDPLSRDVMIECEWMTQQGGGEWAVSLPYRRGKDGPIWADDPRIADGPIKDHPIFFHAHPADMANSLVTRGFGLFTHDPVAPGAPTATPLLSAALSLERLDQ